MSHSHGLPSLHTHSRRRWWAFAAAVVVVYATAVAGFWRYGHDHGEGRLVDAFYLGLQLLLFEPPELQAPINGVLEAARWGAMALAMVAIGGIAKTMFRQEWTRWRLRGARNHIVVFAGERDARAIVAGLRASNARTTIAALVDDHGEHPAERLDPRAFMLFGETARHLHLVRPEHAREVLVVGRDDAANLALAAAVSESANAQRPEGKPLVCHVQIRDVGLRETLRGLTLRERPKSYVRSLDLYERAIRDLLTRDLPIDGAGIAASDPTDVHVVVVGGGEWALATVGVAARVGHFANGRPLRLSVLADDVNRWTRLGEMRFPALADVVRYDAHQWNQDCREWLREAAHVPNTRLLVVVAVSSDADAVLYESVVRSALQGTDARIAVRMQMGPRAAALFAEGAKTSGVQVRVFGASTPATWASLVVEDDREVMALLAHEGFQKLAAAHGRQEAVDRALADWHHLTREDYKESNRQQIDHLPIKLRAVDCEIAEAGDPRPAQPWSGDEIEVLAKMEHRRWMAERRMAGWQHAPGKKDEARRTSPHLVEWERLAEEIRDYDRSAVRAIPGIVGAVGGRKVSRRSPSS
ncbi:MAG: hypothetical protein EPO35_06995 [Acidobacteria bacterium]|nr:MAG: hypothetical protein EPO35_06995 [Acidobacteriota bacterium]